MGKVAYLFPFLSVRDKTAAQASERRWWISAGECLLSACLSPRKSGFGLFLVNHFGFCFAFLVMRSCFHLSEHQSSNDIKKYDPINDMLAMKTVQREAHGSHH